MRIVIILILQRALRYYLRQEPDAVIPHVRIRAGGRPRGRFLPRQVQRPLSPARNSERGTWNKKRVRA